MKSHNWVAMMTIPVDVEVQTSGSVDVSHTELAEELAKGDAIVVCWACDTVLTCETADTECTKVPAKLL